MKLFMTAGVILSLAAFSGAQVVQSPGKSGSAVTKKHEVVKGETLWGLSDKYYGDPFKWGRIYNANLDKISDPDRIYPQEEIAIPEITEPASAALPAPDEMMTLPAAEAADPVAAPAKEVPPPAAEKVSVPASAPANLSNGMPEDQTEWAAELPTIVPTNWQADGVITAKINNGTDDETDSLTEPGDRVRIKVRNPASFRPGDIISAYMKGAVAYDKKTNKKLGLELQKTGILEVLSVKKNIVKARILKANTSVDNGQVIKK